MYQTRIHQWGLDKKLKEHEARAIIHMLARRCGKATRMRLRDLPVDVEKSYSHVRRKGITIDEVLDSDAASLPDLVCETPAVSPRPMPQDLIPTVSADNIIPQLQDFMTMAGPQDLGSPRAFRMVEKLFSDAREFSLGSIHHDPSGKLFYASGATMKVYDAIERAYDLVDQHQDIQGRNLVAKEYSNFETMVADMSHGDVFMMICSIARLLKRQEKQKSMALLLCRLLSSAATNSKSRGHPILSIYGRMFSSIGLLLHNVEAPDYILAAVHVFIDSLTTILGPVHVQTVFATVTLSRVTALLYGPEGLLGPLETLRSSLKEQPGWDTPQSQLVLVELAALNVACGHYQMARNLARQFEILQRKREVPNIQLIEMVRAFLNNAIAKQTRISVISENRLYHRVDEAE